MNKLEREFMGYIFKTEIPDREHFNPLNEMVVVTLTTKKGKKYLANFATPRYIPWVFRKNRDTGECDNGTWWGEPDNILYVKKISDENIRTAIDRAIENSEIKKYFKKFN